MSVLIATLGGSKDVVKLGVRKMENVDKVVLIAGKPLNEIYKDSEIKKDKLIINPVQKALELIQSEPDKDKAVNVTGGTKTLSLAAHSAAWMCGCRAFIILEKGTGVAIKEEFPIPAAGYLDKISKQMKRILARLLMIENALGRATIEIEGEYEITSEGRLALKKPGCPIHGTKYITKNGWTKNTLELITGDRI